MFDFANLANNDKNTSIFYSIGSGDLWQTWIKPKGCSFVNLFVLGSGAGGGAGHSSATQKSGGDDLSKLREQAKGGDKKAADNLLTQRLTQIRGARGGR